MQVESISMKKHTRSKVYDILVVEDDPVQTIILKKLFQKYSLYHVIFKDSIASASEYLDQNSVHAIVSDYNLEDGKGSDLIEYDPEVPIIIMTATKDIDLVVELMKNDEVYDFVLKDYEKNFIELLHRTLEKAIKKFQLTQRLNNQKAQFKQLVENINDVICRTDAEGKILYSNQQVYDISGYNALEMFGEHFSFWVEESHIEIVKEHYDSQVASNQGYTDFEFPIVTKTGKTRWVAQSARMSFDSNGNFLGFLFVIRDITTKKAAELKIKKQNERLHQQNEKIKKNYEELVKAKTSKKALGIVLIIAVVLFLVSEAWLEPIVEQYLGNDNNLAGLAVKGVIALLLKPIDTLLESYLIRRQIKANEKSTISTQAIS